MLGSVKKVGILGAGKLGIVLAQLARKAGYEVLISGSGSPEEIALTVSVMAPGSTPMTSLEVARQAEVVILALPLSKFRNIPKDELAEKLVIDAMNYWWEVDGEREDIVGSELSSSEAVQQFLDKSQVVKALSHMGYHDLHDEAKAEGAIDRKAIAIAGDVESDVLVVASLVNNFGFDPLPIGDLSQGAKLEPGKPAFGVNMGLDSLSELLRRN